MVDIKKKGEKKTYPQPRYYEWKVAKRENNVNENV